MPAPEITPAELAPRLGSVTLIDVRQPAEYGSGCTSRTARLMPLADVPDHLDELTRPRDRRGVPLRQPQREWPPSS